MKTKMNLTIGGERIEMEIENSVTEMREMYKLMKEIIADGPEVMESLETAFEKFEEIEERQKSKNNEVAVKNKVLNLKFENAIKEIERVFSAK